MIGPQEVIEVRDLSAGSAHAVVVVGVDTAASTVYYKDPNASNKVLVFDFAGFAGRVRTVIYAGCAGCTHLAAKVLRRV